MLKIKSAEDFGLGFNCMTRLYMNGYDEEILSDMIKVCQEYLNGMRNLCRSNRQKDMKL